MHAECCFEWVNLLVVLPECAQRNFAGNTAADLGFAEASAVSSSTKRSIVPVVDRQVLWLCAS